VPNMRVLVRASAVTSPEGPLFCAAARGPNRPVPRKSQNVIGLCQVRRLCCYAPCWGFSRNCGARARRRSRFRRPWPGDATRSRSHCTPLMCARWDAYAVTSPEGPLFCAAARGPNRPVPRKSQNVIGLCQVRRLRCYAPCWGFSRTCGATPSSHPHLAQRASSDLCRASLGEAPITRLLCLSGLLGDRAPVGGGANLIGRARRFVQVVRHHLRHQRGERFHALLRRRVSGKEIEA